MCRREAAAFLAEHLVAGGREGDCLLTNPLCFCYMHAFHVSAIFALVLAEYFLVWIIGGQGGVSICFPPH